MKNFLEYALLLILRLFILALPFRGVQLFGRAFGSFIFHVIPIRKELVLSNLRHAFPEKSEQEIRSTALKNFQNIFETFFETFWIQRMTEKHLRSIVRIPELKTIDEILKRGKGLVMLSGHISNWEMMALVVGLMSDHPLQIIVKKQHNPSVDRLMNRLRTKFNNTVVDMDHAPREILKRLREHGVIAMLADQSGPEEGLFIDYFGRPTSTHVGPAVFALRTQAPVLMTYGVRNTDGTFDVSFEEVDTSDLTGTDDEKIRTITERHVNLLEKFVRRYPDQWLWMHKRWKHTDKYLQRKAEEFVS
ncbi:MAG: lysophospholipid acyltransferase family protein [Ignavibacteriales bacterium]|nr:lysophospholipid acyltransferase family protein [Ignavibacteriales bacterium]